MKEEHISRRDFLKLFGATTGAILGAEVFSNLPFVNHGADQILATPVGTITPTLEPTPNPTPDVQNTLNLENYNGKPWEGKYAVKLNSKIIVNSDAHSLHGTITVDGKRYEIKSDGGWDQSDIKDNKERKFSILKLYSTVVGIVGTRFIQGKDVPGFSGPVEVFDILSNYKDNNGKSHLVIFSIPTGDAYGQQTGENRPDRIVSKQEILDMLISGRKIGISLYFPDATWEEMIIAPIKPSDPLARRIAISLEEINTQQKQEIYSFQDKPGPTYIGVAGSFSIN